MYCYSYTSTYTYDKANQLVSSTAIKKFDRRPIPTYEEIYKMFKRKGTKEFRKLFLGTEYIFYYQKNTFSNTFFYIAYTPADEFVFMNIDAPGRIVKKLSSPRSPRSFMIEKIHFGDKEYLAFSIQNMGRTNSSVLFILDEQLNVVYEEHDLYTYEIGTCHDPRYGNCLIVKTGNFHPPQETGDEKYWLYYLPKEVQEDPSESDHSAIRERTAL